MASATWKIKLARQKNADFVYILQRQGRTMICIDNIMCSHVTTHVTVTSVACLFKFLYAKDHGEERERDVTRHCKNIAAARSTISYIIRRFREAGTVENRPRSRRSRAVDDRDYRQLEKIVKTERRAPSFEITAKFNEERNVSVSK